MNKSTYKISESEKKHIEYVLNHGHRVELIPCKDAIKIIQIIRNEVKPEKLNNIPASKR